MALTDGEWMVLSTGFGYPNPKRKLIALQGASQVYMGSLNCVSHDDAAVIQHTKEMFQLLKSMASDDVIGSGRQDEIKHLIDKIEK